MTVTFIRAIEFLSTGKGRKQITPLKDARASVQEVCDWNCQPLLDADICNIYELTLMTEAELAQIPNFSAQDVKDTKLVLGWMNLALDEEAALTAKMPDSKHRRIQRQEIVRAYTALQMGADLNRVTQSEGIIAQAIDESPRMVCDLLDMIDTARKVLGIVAVKNFAADPDAARKTLINRMTAEPLDLDK